MTEPARDASYLRRHPAKARLWRALRCMNTRVPGLGAVYPTKLALLEYADKLDSTVRTRRSMRQNGSGYRMIDQLIQEGWVLNRSAVEGVYKLEAIPMEKAGKPA